MSARIARRHRSFRPIPRRRQPWADEPPLAADFRTFHDSDEEEDDDDFPWPDGPFSPGNPNWDDFNLEPPDDEPAPEDDDFSIEPDEFTDPWNHAAQRAEE
jgi:hypothetical protein